MVLLSTLAACGGGSANVGSPSSEPVVLPTSLASATAAPVAPNDAIGVNLIERPQEFVFDGEIAEWPNFSPEDPGADPEQPDEPREQEPVATQNVGAVGLVVEQAGVLVVGHLPAPAVEAVWIGLGNRPAQLPYIGQLGRAAASFDPVVCSEMELDFTDGMYVTSDRPTPPETLAACRAVVARYDAYVAEQSARFSRTVRIDASGVADGASGAAVAGAKVLWKKLPDGSATFEATLPVSALPRVAAAPLMSMRLLARSRAITVPASRWTSVGLPLPLSFEPHSQLRSELFQMLSGAFGSLPYQPPAGLSFHPSKPTLIESFEYGGETIAPSEQEIFVEHAKLGDVRIGKVNIARSFLASYKGDEFVELYEPIHGWGPTTTSEPVARNGAHHLLHYSERLYGGGMAFEPPGCAVSEIGSDGKFKELLTAEADTPPYPESGSIWWNFDAAELFSNKNFTEFGFRGTARENAGEQPAEKKWRWDKKKKAYVALDWKMGAHKAK